MADGVVFEGVAICKNLAVNENDVLLGSVSEDSSNTVDSGKSSYFGLDESEALCSKYGVQLGSCSGLDGRMMRSNSEEFAAALKSMQDENGHNCRKKRCADRYDSSESSDSGVATLSCTDCSGSSSGTSDITEPGSPFSTSSHSESDPDPETNTSTSTSSPNKMPPTQSAWPWADHPPPRYFLHTSTSASAPASAKRLKHDNNNGKDLVLDDCLRRKCCDADTGASAALQQGKITEYFKTQLKPQSHKRCIVDNKLAVHISGTVVPVVAELPLVFQRPKTVFKNDQKKPVKQSDDVETNSRLSTPVPHHRKSLVSNHEPPAKPVTPALRKPVAVPKCDSPTHDSVLLPKPKSLLETTCSTPNSSLDTIASTSPLFVSTSEQCSDKPSLPSPILRTPSVIRFPARNGWKGHFLSDIICRWSGCDESFATSTGLLEHLQVEHVNTQKLGEKFVCHWTGCKVYDRVSCSRSWLERHVLSHGGNKPFRCIVDGCGQRFSSQIMLERHVNQHFNQSENSSSSGASSKKSLDSTPNKLFRRNGKKLRYRRQPFSARTFDYFDTGIMEGLQHSLLTVTKRQTLGQVDCISNKSVTLYSKVIGRRTLEDGSPNVLLRWFPADILGDEWVTESEAKRQQTRTVSSQQCGDFHTLYQPPMFRPRPSHHQRKQSATR